MKRYARIAIVIYVMKPSDNTVVVVDLIATMPIEMSLFSVKYVVYRNDHHVEEQKSLEAAWWHANIFLTGISWRGASIELNR